MSTVIRTLRADEVELRAAQCGMTRSNKPYATLLIYKDARVDQRILDETFGPFNWQREHQVIDGRLYCTVSIWDKEKGQWVSKQDVGTESNTEKEKGQASDSFKRACFNWGIGRELYTAPFICIPASKCNIKDGKNGSKQCFDKFEIEKIIIENKKIMAISILNTSIESDDIKQRRCFVWQRDKQ